MLWVNYNLRDEDTSALVRVSFESFILAELEFGVLVFVEGEKPLEQGEEPTTNTTIHGIGLESNPRHIGLVEGERSYNCAIPSPRNELSF